MAEIQVHTALSRATNPRTLTTAERVTPFGRRPAALILVPRRWMVLEQPTESTDQC